jgi:hypothetical protein
MPPRAAYSWRVELPRRAAARPQRRCRRRAGLAARAAQSAAGAGSRDSLRSPGGRRRPPRAGAAVGTRSSPRPTRRPRVRAGCEVVVAVHHPHPLRDAAPTLGHPPAEPPGDRPTAAPDRAHDRSGDPGVVGARGAVAAGDGCDRSQRARYPPANGVNGPRRARHVALHGTPRSEGPLWATRPDAPKAASGTGLETAVLAAQPALRLVNALTSRNA